VKGRRTCTLIIAKVEIAVPAFAIGRVGAHSNYLEGLIFCLLVTTATDHKVLLPAFHPSSKDWRGDVNLCSNDTDWNVKYSIGLKKN